MATQDFRKEGPTYRGQALNVQMWLKVSLGLHFSIAALQTSELVHLTGSDLSLKESGSLMVAWAASSCFLKAMSGSLMYVEKVKENYFPCVFLHV